MCSTQFFFLIGSMITLCCFYPTSNGLLQSKNIFASRWYTVQPYEEKWTNLYELVVCIFLPSNITHNQHRREHQTEFIGTISEYDKKNPLIRSERCIYFTYFSYTASRKLWKDYTRALKLWNKSNKNSSNTLFSIKIDFWIMAIFRCREPEAQLIVIM